jgi:hypothetical protein
VGWVLGVHGVISTHCIYSWGCRVDMEAWHICVVGWVVVGRGVAVCGQSRDNLNIPQSSTQLRAWPVDDALLVLYTMQC